MKKMNLLLVVIFIVTPLLVTNVFAKEITKTRDEQISYIKEMLSEKNVKKNVVANLSVTDFQKYLNDIKKKSPDVDKETFNKLVYECRYEILKAHAKFGYLANSNKTRWIYDEFLTLIDILDKTSSTKTDSLSNKQKQQISYIEKMLSDKEIHKNVVANLSTTDFQKYLNDIKKKSPNVDKKMFYGIVYEKRYEVLKSHTKFLKAYWCIESEWVGEEIQKIVEIIEKN